MTCSDSWRGCDQIMQSGYTRRPWKFGAGVGALRIIGSWALEAHHQEKNHHRRYEMTIGRDLLDFWTVAIRYGRAGQGGTLRRYASPHAPAMQDLIRDRLRRRLSAPRRIDCSYRLAALSAVPGFDTAAWLPGEIMARFFQQG